MQEPDHDQFTLPDTVTPVFDGRDGPAGPEGTRVADRKIGVSWLAWIVILAYVAWVMLRVAGVLPLTPAASGPASAASKAAAEAAALESSMAVESVLLELQSRFSVGAAEYGFIPRGTQTASQFIEPLRAGTVRNRLRVVILAMELGDESSAREELSILHQELEDAVTNAGYQPRPSDLSLLALLDRIYDDSAGRVPGDVINQLTRSERTQLTEELGWFGQVALGVPDGSATDRDEAIEPAVQTIFFIILIGAAVFVAFVTGFILDIIFIVRLATGTVQSGIQQDRRRIHGVYAETFAIWLILFELTTHVLPNQLLPSNASMPMQFGAVIAGFFLSLIALVWPRLRGVKTAAHDIGFHGGKQNAFVELVWGPLCYAMTLPVLAVGLVGTLILLQASGFIPAGGGGGGAGGAVNGFAGSGAVPFQPMTGPAHPIVGTFASKDITALLSVILLGSVAAPIVEEIVFRGVLYRHLREATRRFAWLISAIISGGLTALVFAAVHPQGIIGIPVLMSLAIGFGAAREIRGSLIAPIVMHAISNSLTFSILVLALL